MIDIVRVAVMLPTVSDPSSSFALPGQLDEFISGQSADGLSSAGASGFIVSASPPEQANAVALQCFGERRWRLLALVDVAILNHMTAFGHFFAVTQRAPSSCEPRLKNVRRKPTLACLKIIQHEHCRFLPLLRLRDILL
ncbi:MAG: hypothetical protein WCE40_00310 [Polyangia bacterium]